MLRFLFFSFFSLACAACASSPPPLDDDACAAADTVDASRVPLASGFQLRGLASSGCSFASVWTTARAADGTMDIEAMTWRPVDGAWSASAPVRVGTVGWDADAFVAWDGSAYVIVYHDWADGTLRQRTVDATGSALGPAIVTRQLVPRPLNVYAARLGGLVVPRPGEIGVVYTTNTGPDTVQLLVVGEDGSSIVEPTALARAKEDEIAVASSGDTNLVFFSGDSGADESISAVTFDGEGRTRGAPQPFARRIGEFFWGYGSAVGVGSDFYYGSSWGTAYQNFGQFVARVEGGHLHPTQGIEGYGQPALGATQDGHVGLVTSSGTNELTFFQIEGDAATAPFPLGSTGSFGLIAGAATQFGIVTSDDAGLSFVVRTP